MKKEVGLWVDHRRAIIVINLDQEEEIKQIASNVDKHVRYSGASQASDSHNDSSEDGRDRRFGEQLSRYYDEIIPYLHDSTSVLIMGPGEAKFELQKRFEGHEPNGCIVAMKTAHRMTDHQVVAQIRQHFHDSQTGSNRIVQPLQTARET